MRFAAVDVHYPIEGGARAALVVATDPTFAPVTERHIAWLDEVADYQPGSFFLRELPAIQAVLALTEPIDVLIVDGYVDLDPSGRPGLGARVHDELRIPVIGVAKTSFHTATHAAAVLRGSAIKPLYVTAVGTSLDEAARLVAAMAGPYRVPEALRLVDQLARALV